LAVALGACLTLLTASSVGYAYLPPNAAGTEPDSVRAPSSQRHRTFGLEMDVGVPDGAALGFSVRPWIDWCRIVAAGSYNGMAPGVRGGLTLDPIAFPIAPTLTVEGGHFWAGSVPATKDSLALGYNYMNFHLGLEIGSRDTFRFFLRGGVSWVDITSGNYQTAEGTGTATLSNPSYSGWVAPSGKLGFTTYF